MKLSKFLPFLGWLPQYKSTSLKGDLSAGLTVGVMLIPQGMAYAMIAGLPPIYGLYASTIPLIVYALLGSSRQLAVGPVAMVSLLTAAGVGILAEGGTETYIILTITLAFLVGVIQFLLGVFRLGFLVNFLSHPVISGFTSAAALIIGLSQLKHLLGVDIPRSHHVHEIIIHAFEKVGAINWMTFTIGIVGIALIQGARKINKSIPGPLIAVVLSILAVWLFDLTSYGVKIVGEVPSGLPSFGLPKIDLETLQMLAPTAIAVSLVSFMESIAVAKAIQAKHNNYKIIPNQELIALGAANIIGSFFKSYPTTGGFSRTAVNDQSGAQTGMASIVSALLIILTLLFLTPLFYFLPNAILASVIMVAVFGLINLSEVKHLFQTDRTDFWMLLVTFGGTLALGIEQGILIGVLLSLGAIIYKTSLPHIAVLGKIPGKPHYRNIERFDELEIREDILIVRFDALLYFANVEYFNDQFESMIDKKGENIRLVILDADSINGLDSSGSHGIKKLFDFCKVRGIQFFIVGAKGPIRDKLKRTGLFDELGDDSFFFRIQHAVDYFDNISAHRYKRYATQTNIEG